MTTGLALGTIAWASMIATFTHLPRGIKKFLVGHFLIADAIATGLTFTFLSGISKSLAAVIGSLTCGLLVNLTLMAKAHLDREEQIAELA